MARCNTILAMILVGAWGLGLVAFPVEYTTRDVLHQAYLLTGMTLWGLMTECLVIAARPGWLERVTGMGMNRLMKAHRSLGWAVLVLLILHMASPVVLMVLSPRAVPMMGTHDVGTFWKAVWIISHPVCAFSGVLVTFWVLWLVAQDVRRAVGRISWTAWESGHRRWAWAYLLMAPHCLRLLKETEMLMPLGWLNLAMTLLGIWAAVRLLRRRAGVEKREAGAVRAVTPGADRIKLEVSTMRAACVRPGQYVYLSRPGDAEEPHPFSVAGIHEGRLQFWIRPAGTWTRALATAAAGETMVVEGPWGRFAPPETPEALWVAAGSGIAPFLSWMRERCRLSRRGTALASARLVWSVHEVHDSRSVDEVRELAQQAQVAFTLFVTTKEKRRLRAEDLDLARVSTLAVCASSDMVGGLRRLWKAAGGRADAFLAEVA